MLQALSCCGPLLDSLLYAHVFCSGDAWNGHSTPVTVSAMLSVEGKDRLPQTADNNLSNTSQDTIRLVCHRDTLFIAVQLGVPGSFLWSCFPADWPPACIGTYSYFSPDAGLRISPCWTWGYSHQTIFSSLPRTSGWSYQPLLTVWCHQQICWRVHTAPLSKQEKCWPG